MVAERIHHIDGCRVFLGFDRGAVAGMALPPSVASYSRDEADFPDFAGRFAPPADAELVAAVSWDSIYRGYLGLAAGQAGKSGFRDIRHAYFVGPSPTSTWSWLLYLLVYDDDNERWEWHIAAATDRELADRLEAAHWLLESFWCWLAAYARGDVGPVDEVCRSGLLGEADILSLSRRTLQPWTVDERGPFAPREPRSTRVPSREDGGVQVFPALSVVRVKAFIDRADGTKRLASDDDRRPPEIGDTGTVVEILHAPGNPRMYLVESCDSTGASVWVCDFLAEELELVWLPA